jgi:flavorubredoxin
MSIRKIKERIYAVGVNHWDRRLFDELIPLPDGTSYNSYIVKGSEKTVLIDSVEPEVEMELFNNLKKLNIDKIDYIISNHAEQDHSGTIPKLLDMYKHSKVLTNPKCKDFLKNLLLIQEDKFETVNDGDTISLGDRTLKFIITPWVHWPETMLTYLEEDRILFPCDLFGSHLATSKLYAEEKDIIYEAAKRYYAEIMMPFRITVKKNIEKIKNLEIDIIAPSHGPIHKGSGFIIDAYKAWLSDDVKNEVVLPYVSMHGSTKRMVDYLINALIERDIVVKPFNLTVMDIGKLAVSLVDAATVVLATPTVLAGAHPTAAHAVFLLNALRPKTRFISVIGSYGWGGRMLDQVTGILSNIKAEILTPVIIKGFPKGEDFKLLDILADTILKRHKEINMKFS